MSDRRPMRPGSMMGRGGPHAMMKGDNARDFRGTMKKLIAHLGRYRLPILVVIVFAVASTAFRIVGPKILGMATTTLFTGVVGAIGGPGSGIGIDFGSIGRFLSLALALYVVSAAFAYVQGWIMSGIAIKLTFEMRRDVLAKINRMPFRYFDNTNHGEVLSRITNDVDTVNQTLSQSLSQMITSVATVIGIIVMMLVISPLMTLVALLAIPLSLATIRFVVKRSQKFFARQQEYLGHVNGHIEEMFGAHPVVKAFNGEEKNIEEFIPLNDSLHEAGWKSQFLSGIMMPLMSFVGNLGYVGVAITGGVLAARGAVEVGDIQAFIQYVRSFTQPMSQIANISNILQQTAAAAERIFEFLEEEEENEPTSTDDVERTALEEARGNAVEPAARRGSVEGRVEFINVRFGYTAEKTIIKEFSCRIEPGQKVAIVGPTGAGKTTLVKLLMRFYEVDGGSITVDGRDLRSYPKDELRRIFGMVLQDTWLFNGTVRENIGYGRSGADDREVEEAAIAAHADHFIRAFPGGYDTELNEETSNISQGQKQLLTIARAIIADPDILILDEATSSVDTHTEVLIQRAMNRLMEGRTSFIIAHRLSTIRDADLILVMNQGDIVEQGTHRDLLAAGGFYAELYNSQFERDTEDAV